MYNKRSLGNFSLRKRAYMLIAELCLSMHWFMWLYSCMLWLVVITTVGSRDMDIEFCYINAVTYCQFQLMYETILKFVIKSFVIKYVYGSKELGCAETRKTWWEKLKKKSTQRLIPDKDTLNHICLRANYLAYCQKNFHLSHHPSPIGNDWGIIDGKCRPVRNVLPALPASLPSRSAQSDKDCSNSEQGYWWLLWNRLNRIWKWWLTIFKWGSSF